MPSKVLIVLGKNIRALREKMEWTQDRLALSIGTTRGTINRLEMGKQQVRDETIARIASALGVEDIDLYQMAPFEVHDRIEANPSEQPSMLSAIEQRLEKLEKAQTPIDNPLVAYARTFSEPGEISGAMAVLQDYKRHLERAGHRRDSKKQTGSSE